MASSVLLLAPTSEGTSHLLGTEKNVSSAAHQGAVPWNIILGLRFPRYFPRQILNTYLGR